MPEHLTTLTGFGIEDSSDSSHFQRKKTLFILGVSKPFWTKGFVADFVDTSTWCEQKNLITHFAGGAFQILIFLWLTFQGG